MAMDMMEALKKALQEMVIPELELIRRRTPRSR
jgi:hypothetical protein